MVKTLSASLDLPVKYYIHYLVHALLCLNILLRVGKTSSWKRVGEYELNMPK
jgi:hypothetical protein